MFLLVMVIMAFTPLHCSCYALKMITDRQHDLFVRHAYKNLIWQHVAMFAAGSLVQHHANADHFDALRLVG